MRRIVTTAGGLVMAALFVWSSLRWFQGRELGAAAMQLLRSPGILLFMTAGYGFSFVLKAIAWRLYVGREREDRLRDYVYPLFISLLVNHLLPIKLGDLARTGMLVRITRMRWDDALHSVAIMRLLDMASLLLIGSVGAVLLGLEASPKWSAITVGSLMIILLVLFIICMSLIRNKWRQRSASNVGAAGKVQALLGFVKRHLERLWLIIRSRRGAVLTLLTLISWMMEGAVVYGVILALDLRIGPLQAVWANGMTIAGQIFHVTPGGIGTYETTLTASLGVLGMAGAQAYTVALLSHGYKFVFAYLVGIGSLLLAAVSWSELRKWLNPRGKKESNES
ncbi:hypothetical protein Back11_51990 [Paenibacillus baekrokdamisoli]|uniref:Phosphatidylglycerol lysyltransferase n=1 Tax=Paenibacillus baekrokdamisoli TaxID=1712516 RepID=A0A3G9JLT0_9BACL|nr:lysylphosphatidylglycerol synthase transmembrane domain-containing protein [Paenibacillus baekrokdamisoli]MBB3069034.1 hypothetical protein [Paenibacillus baekrokdamisoli]BBH23854.1 hypothetical protein Back11_51990 [Paenibacillus baekrokdamisoli]